jgi:hypothetical protein
MRRVLAAHVRPSRARHCEERSDEAIHNGRYNNLTGSGYRTTALDCFASLAMTTRKKEREAEHRQPRS